MVGRVEVMARMAHAPLIADGDTGYGGLLNVRHTVQGYERAGAAAIQLEDQEFPKKCGHTPGRRVIAADDMVRKIAVAVEARQEPRLPDHRPHRRAHLARPRRGDPPRQGLCRGGRGHAVHRVAGDGRGDGGNRPRARRRPLVANMVEGGRTPMLSNARLAALGYALAIYPVAGLLSAAAALDAVYGQIRDTGSSLGSPAPHYPFAEMNRLMGFEEVWRFDREHAEI